MMELDLDDFATVATARAAHWRAEGVECQLHRNSTGSKPSAWIDCTTMRRLVQLTVWTSGEAELLVGDVAVNDIAVTVYQLNSITELAACLDDLAAALSLPPASGDS
ncbi:hypothetical protein [Paractinoplanes toevensis]|uniref:Uncharacterized protein n=1 Tax=Paractinoplanes toevensis TaxID=571911 RepID=A0A919W8X1_9ACTN|nr:hypothetical protein [Actinoplanes toevensis]GIM95767.1 hypothetical protein Ato02nite_075600 [Actinoplanes toevensis]